MAPTLVERTGLTPASLTRLRCCAAKQAEEKSPPDIGTWPTDLHTANPEVDARLTTSANTDTWSVRQEVGFDEATIFVQIKKEGRSTCGIAVSADGTRVYATTAKNTLAEAAVASDGRLAWMRKIELPGPEGKGRSFPCGIALALRALISPAETVTDLAPRKLGKGG